MDNKKPKNKNTDVRLHIKGETSSITELLVKLVRNDYVHEGVSTNENCLMFHPQVNPAKIPCRQRLYNLLRLIRDYTAKHRSITTWIDYFGADIVEYKVERGKVVNLANPEKEIVKNKYQKK